MHFGNQILVGYQPGMMGHWAFVEDFTTPMLVSTWYHVAVTYDAATTTMRLYRDGVEVASNVSVPPYLNGNQVQIGSYQAFFHMYGSIDEVRIWNRALCQDEIQQNMNCELDPRRQAGLVALYHFNQGTVGANNAGITQLTDASGNANHGTLVNFALNGATSNWAAGNASGTCAPFCAYCLSGYTGWSNGKRNCYC